MKLAEQTREVTKYGVEQESEFDMANNAFAFDLLSSKIYQDVPLAIVRELSTNALDSHIEAGNPERPFYIKLPNSLDYTFSIRDYGTGISPEDIQAVYKTYFKSTKRDSDNVTGCLGLGSKTPFAYGDQFLVTSYYNGIKYMYSAYKNTNGIPNISLLDTDPTTEHNGLELSFQVKPGDIASFKAAADKVYYWFEVKPDGYDFANTFSKATAAYAVDNAVLYTDTNHILTETINVLMGNICYPVDVTQIDRAAICQFLQPWANGNHGLTKYRLVISAPMGAVVFQPSREGLHYNANTKNYIMDQINKFGNAYETELISRANCEDKSEWEKYYLLRDSNGFMNNSQYLKFGYASYPQDILTYSAEIHHKKKTLSWSKYDSGHFDKFLASNFIDPSPYYMILDEDPKKSPIKFRAKILDYLNARGFPLRVTHRRYGYDSTVGVENLIMFRPLTPKGFSILEQMFGKNLKKTSDLPQPKIAKIAKPKVTVADTTFVKKWSHNSTYGYPVHDYVGDTFDIGSADAMYIRGVMNSKCKDYKAPNTVYRWGDKKQGYSFDGLNTFINTNKAGEWFKMFCDKYNIIGVSPAKYEPFKLKYKLISFAEFIEKFYKDHAENIDVFTQSKIYGGDYVPDIIDHLANHPNDLKSWFGLSSECDDLIKYLDKSSIDHAIIKRLRAHFNAPSQIAVKTSVIDKFLGKYPLLNFCGYPDIAQVTQYIKLVEGK